MIMRLAVPAIAFLALAACSATGDINVSKPKSDEIRPASTVALELDATPAAGSPEHAEEAIRIARADLSEKLISAGGFQQVVAPGQPADYTMNVTLSQVKLLPFGARYFGGIYGAVNVVNGDVSLVDNATGVELTSYSANIKGAASAWSSESGTNGTIGAFDDKVIEGLN